MGDEIAFPPSKKRAAGRELSRDNPGDDEEDISELESGTFKKASEEVLASRRIVKVRRSQTSSTPTEPSSNPFAGIRLVPFAPAEAANEVKASAGENVGEEVDKPEEANKDTNGDSKETQGKEEEKTDIDVVDASKEKEKGEGAAGTTPAGDEEVGDNNTKEAEVKSADEDKSETKEKKDQDSSRASPFGSFQQLSSTKNAFTGLAGSGFSTTTFSFGSAAKDGSASGSGLFESKDQLSITSFGFTSSNNGNTPLFSSLSGGKSEIPAMQEVSVETGEESEETVFNADAVLYEFAEGGWKERGKGEVKINVLKEGTKKARLVMRSKGNYRLILNAALYPDMKLTAMEKKGVTFACLNSASEGVKSGLVTWALKFRDGSFVESFSAAVTAHKGGSGEADDDKTNSQVKTHENSPQAADV